MFYKLNQNELLELEPQLAKIKEKLQTLEGQNDTKSLNKQTHLNECKEALIRCLEKQDEDQYDFFLYLIYTLAWGEADAKVDKHQAKIQSLKELSKSVLKDEVDALINTHPLMLQRLEEYDENGVPRKITIRQAKLALLQAELLDDVEVLMQNAPKEAQISWEYATEFERDNALILFFQKQVNLSDEFVDMLFKKAKEL